MKKIVVFKSSRTGRFVSVAEAEAAPDTTFRQTIKVPDKEAAELIASDKARELADSRGAEYSKSAEIIFDAGGEKL